VRGLLIAQQPGTQKLWISAPTRAVQRAGPGLGTTRTQLEGQRVVPERVIPQK